MRPIDDATLTALDGSRPADTVIVWAWRGGSLVLPEPLQVVDWSFADAAGDSTKVGQQISLTIADPDGTLGAWRFDDPLGVGGTRLQVIYRVGGAGAINYGWYRITGNKPQELVDWRDIDEYGNDEPDSELGPHRRRVPIITAVVRIDAVDLTDDLKRDRFEAPQSPDTGASIISEFRRLTEDYFPTVVDPGVTDRGVSPFLILDGERLEAGQDLLSRINARYRMGGDGECHVYPLTTPVVLRVEPGKALVSVSREQTIDGLYNRWVVEGKDTVTGQPIVAAVELEYGPLRYGGDHGRVPFTYTSEMITTFQQALEYARELRAKFLASLAVTLTVEIAPHPELQADDRIEVGCPVAAGHVAYFPGTIATIRRAGSPVPTANVLTVSCSYSDVTTALARTTWAGNLTRTMPELTWDRMPATWGSVPPMTWDELP